MDLKDKLFELSNVVGVAGDEFSAASIACNMLKEFARDAHIDSFGNVIGNIGERCEDKPHILLDAHIDQIGMIVTNITDDGFLKVSGCGGIDRRLLLAQQVTVYGKEAIKGVITSTPPHLEEDNKKVPKVENIYIDIGMSKESAEKIVSLGDRVIIDSDCCELLNGRVTSKAIDDRSGVLAILYALEKVKGKELPYSVTALFSAQEETGERGAKTAAFKINPDLAIAVDVSFALTADESEYKCGKMSEGVMIGVAPSLSKEMSNAMIALAKEKNIPYQIEVMGGTTGTNADVIGVTRNGVKTVTLSLPLKYMHTPVEVIDLKDIETTGNLIAEFLLNGGVR